MNSVKKGRLGAGGWGWAEPWNVEIRGVASGFGFWVGHRGKDRVGEVCELALECLSERTSNSRFDTMVGGTHL